MFKKLLITYFSLYLALSPVVNATTLTTNKNINLAGSNLSTNNKLNLDKNNGDRLLYNHKNTIHIQSNPIQTQLKYLHVQKTANHLFLSLLSTQPSRKRNHPNPNHQPKRQS